MLTSGPPALRVFVDISWDRPNSWGTMLQSDFQWLESYLEPDKRGQNWIQVARQDPRLFRLTVDS
eukprot:3202025-Pyramimonas_sp.AAC.1